MIADLTGTHRRGIEEPRQRFVENGFEVTFKEKPRGLRPRVLTGEDEARLIALVCETVPEGSVLCTLKLLEDTWVTLENTDTKTVSRETIRQTLKKLALCPWLKREWCIPPQGKRGVCSQDGGCP
jgi:hypothetical protein